MFSMDVIARRVGGEGQWPSTTNCTEYRVSARGPKQRLRHHQWPAGSLWTQHNCPTKAALWRVGGWKPELRCRPAGISSRAITTWLSSMIGHYHGAALPSYARAVGVRRLGSGQWLQVSALRAGMQRQCWVRRRLWSGWVSYPGLPGWTGWTGLICLEQATWRACLRIDMASARHSRQPQLGWPRAARAEEAQMAGGTEYQHTAAPARTDREFLQVSTVEELFHCE